MKRFLVIGVALAAVAALALIAPRFAKADDSPLRAEIVANMLDAGNKVEELAGAMPEKKYAWRPMKGVRSFGEVCLHVCQANYLIGMFAGATPPVSKDELMKMDKMTADKAKIAQMLKDSYAFASKVVSDTPDSDLDTMVDFFGNKITKRSMFMTLAAHSHEHLGQAIAYSRTNGVVPPWTAREMEAAKKAAAEKKNGSGM